VLARRLTTTFTDLTVAEAIDTTRTIASPASPGGAPPSSPPGHIAPRTTPFRTWA
jgi:hypothetical protein